MEQGTLGAFLSDYTLRTVAAGAVVLGLVSGSLGCYAVLRGRALLGDAISHAALPGIALAFMLTGSKAPAVLVTGAALAGWLATLALLAIVAKSRIKEDAALGMVLSVFFGAGMVLLTFIQRTPTASQAGLDKFLFGQAATLMRSDVELMTLIGACAIAVTLLFWKEFKLLSFDAEFAASMGFRVRLLDILQTSLLVIAIVVGLQTVGVVLMSAMVVAPAAAARQWTNSLAVMMVLAAVLGAVGGAAGALMSATTTGLPTGPVIVLMLTGIVIVSLLLAPGRGIVWRWWTVARSRREVRLHAVLADMMELSRQHDSPKHPHSEGALEAMSVNRGSVQRTLAVLRDEGLAMRQGDGKWSLTDKGIAAAEERRNDRADPGEDS